MRIVPRSIVSAGYGAARALRNLALAAIFTGTALAANAAPVTIAALGDSLTAGYGLAPEDGFVPQLQAWLTAHGADVKVLNAGVSGDTTAGGLARADWTLTPDVRGMILTLGGNDMLRGIDPAEVRANLTGILDKARAHGVRVLLVGMKAPGNYGTDYRAAFNAVYPDLAKSYGTLYAGNFLGALLAVNADGSAVYTYMQADAIHPNAKGVALIVAALGPQVLELIGSIGP